jgi:hypothetical protein
MVTVVDAVQGTIDFSRQGQCSKSAARDVGEHGGKGVGMEREGERLMEKMEGKETRRGKSKEEGGGEEDEERRTRRGERHRGMTSPLHALTRTQ